MHVWLVEIGEPISLIKNTTRDWRCSALSRALAAQGHTVTWWASTFEHITRQYLFDGPRVLDPLPGIQVRLLHGPAYYHSKSPMRFLHHFVIAQAFAHEAQRVPKPDIIVCHLPTLELAEQAVLYGKNVGVPVVIEIHDLWPDHYVAMVPRRLRGMFKWMLTSEFRRVRRILKNATSIMAISDAYLSWGLKHAGRKKRMSDAVFPIGYSPLSPSQETLMEVGQVEFMVQHGIELDALIVTFAGTFTSSFDIPTVFEAAQGLSRDREHDVRFVIVGEGDKGQEWRACAQGLTNVVFTGWLDHPGVMAALRCSSVGLAPYDSALISLPNKPFEYMAAGLPLLSSLRGELESLIRDEQIGLQYQAGNVESLGDRIRWFADNPAERMAMGQRARKLFEERFSVDVIYPKLVAYLEQVATNAIMTSSGKSRAQRKA